MRRAARSVALSVVTCLSLALPLAGVAAAGQGDGSGQGGSGEQVNKAEVLATLVIENPGVDVKAKGEDAFAPATGGQKLRAGDTVRTGATGRAEVDYSEDAYTRLDVNTTFKIVKLSEDQGARQVEGGLDSGRTWNRTEAVTQSGKFEQSGAGATAAVAGTAFAMTCSGDGSLAQCRYQDIVHDVILTGDDGEEQRMTPLTGCIATDGTLCDELTHLTPEQLAADAWIQENLLRDLLERGYGPGPFVIQGTLVIQDGVITFDETPPPPPPVPPTTPTTIAPSVANPPIDCELLTPTTGENACTTASAAEFEPTSTILVYDGNQVRFVVNIEQNGDGGPVSVVFDEVPANTGTYCLDGDTVEGFCQFGSDLVPGDSYPADSVFHFDATYCEGEGCSNLPTTGNLVFHLENEAGAKSKKVTVPVTVFCEFCGGEEFAATSGNTNRRPGVGGGNEGASRNGDASQTPTTAAPDPTVTTTAPPTTVQGDPSGAGEANTRGNG